MAALNLRGEIGHDERRRRHHRAAASVGRRPVERRGQREGLRPVVDAAVQSEEREPLLPLESVEEEGRRRAAQRVPSEVNRIE